MIDNFYNKLKQLCPSVIQNELLSQHTSIGVGGKAQYFLATNNLQEIIDAFKLAQSFNINILFLGGGTNLIVSDRDFSGLVISPQLFAFEILDNSYENIVPKSNYARHSTLTNSDYQTNLPDPFNLNDPKVLVKVGSSFRINGLIAKLNQVGITGLEWFSGIPGTVGGAIYMNIHGGKYFFADFVSSVEVLSKNGTIKNYPNSELNFNYDYSIFHESKEVILSTNLVLFQGDLPKAQKIVNEWGAKKILSQPQRSCGCIWQNLDSKTQERLDLPTPSVGYIIDKVLNLKGTQKGGAIISSKHAAFIENLGNASFDDIIYLINLVEDKFQAKYNFSLKKEIEIIN